MRKKKTHLRDERLARVQTHASGIVQRLGFCESAQRRAALHAKNAFAAGRSAASAVEAGVKAGIRMQRNLTLSSATLH